MLISIIRHVPCWDLSGVCSSLINTALWCAEIALEDELGDEEHEDLYHGDEPVDDDIDRDGLDDFIVRDTGENDMGRSRGQSMYSGQNDRAVQVSILCIAIE